MQSEKEARHRGRWMFRNFEVGPWRTVRRLSAVFLLLLGILAVTFTGTRPVQAADATVTINKNIQYQKIDGFGGFGQKNVPWGTPPLWDQDFVNRTIDDLGLTITREEVPSNFSPDPGVYNVYNQSTNSCDGTHQPLGSQIDFIKAMKAKADASGEEWKFIASIWSPPDWMKYVKCIFGGDINWNRLIVSEIPSAENPNDRKNDFAEYCVQYVKTIKQLTGVDVYAFSIQNEPAFAQGYQSAVYSPEVLANTLKVVGQRFDQEGITTKLFIPEDVAVADRLTSYVQWAGDDPAARQHMDIMAVHDYGLSGTTPNPQGNLDFWKSMNDVAARYNVPLWQTETSGYKQDWGGAMWLGEAMHTALKYGKASAWVYWSMSEENASDYSLMINGQPTSLYHVSKQYYRYIRPGAVMVEANASDPNILTTAFRHDAKKSMSVVMINKNSSAKSVSLGFQGNNIPGQFSVIRSTASEGAVNAGTVASNGTLTLPANSVVTLYGTANNADGASAPTIISAPQSQSVAEGHSVTFRVQANGSPNLSYQWQRNGVDIAGATGSLYTISPRAEDNGAQYRVRVTNAVGNITSAAATLTVGAFNGATVATASSAPTIDGNAGDTVWNNAQSYPLNKTIGTPNNLSASFKSAWDNNNLYFLVDVNDPTYATGTNNVEFYLDGNNSKAKAYVQNDWQYIFTWGSTTVSQYQGGQPGNHVAGHYIGNIQFAQVANGSSGYRLEVKIPWSTLGVTATQGKHFGLDIDVAQQSTPGTTSGKVFWHNTTDNAWRDPSTFGVAKLGGGTSSGGTGLKGDYYNSNNLSGTVALTRTDSTVNFDWGNGSPASGTVNSDNFSARWTGQVQPATTGSYTFTTDSDDGIRLWVNGQLVIDNWTDHAPTLNTSAAITLTGGQKYTIKLEYYERGGGAVARLLWTPPGSSRVVVPQSALYVS